MATSALRTRGPFSPPASSSRGHALRGPRLKAPTKRALQAPPPPSAAAAAACCLSAVQSDRPSAGSLTAAEWCCCW